MKELLKRLTKAKQPEPSPAGTIDKTGAKHAGAAGLAMAPVGAYTNEFVTLIYDGINGYAPGFVQKIMHLSFAEDLVGGATGFCVGAVVTAIWKFLRHYE